MPKIENREELRNEAELILNEVRKKLQFGKSLDYDELTRIVLDLYRVIRIQNRLLP
jgi:hypothetical protein